MAEVLLVCTGNICRTPMAEGLLRTAFARHMGEEAPVVASAGTIARDGALATEEAVRAAAELGVDISGHVARRLRPAYIREVDVVIGMAGEHRDEVVALVPDAAGRTFALKELVGLLEAIGPVAGDAGGADSPIARRAAQADRARRPVASASPGEEDVLDPLGLPLEAYRAVAHELLDLCERLARGLRERSVVGPGPAD